MHEGRLADARIAVTTALNSRGIHAIYDPASDGFLILPMSDTRCDESLWDLAMNAPVVRLDENDLLSDHSEEIALRRCFVLLDQMKSDD